MQCGTLCCSVTACCSLVHGISLCCSVLRCAAVCLSVLPCVAVYCSVLQCAAVCCRVLPCVAVYCSVLQCVAEWVVCCYILQYVASCCYALQCVTVLLCTAVRYSVLSARAEGSGFEAHSTLQHTATHCNTGFEARDARPQEGRGHEATSRHHHTRLAREIPRGVPKVERGMHVCFQYVCM
jgi:hypothetical protein